MDRNQIIKAIDDYAKATGLKQTTICQYAIRNRRFYKNLKDGLDYRVGTARRVLDWIDENQPEAAE